MSADDNDDERGEGEGTSDGQFGDEPADVRDRLEQEADRAVEQFDEGIVDLLSWVLDTETRARIYVHLRQHPDSTSDEIAEGTGLYPSTVREALAELHDEGKVTRRKRESSGAGNNPYEYAAIAPSDLVGDVVDDVQRELNTVFNLDSYLGQTDREEPETDEEPVTINVEEDPDDADEPDFGDDIDVDTGDDIDVDTGDERDDGDDADEA